MKRKDNEVRSDYDFGLDELILDTIFDNKIMSIDRIRNLLNKKYSRKLGWITIKRHIDRLLDRKEVSIYYENDKGKKKVRLYKVHNNSRIISIIHK